MYISNDMKKFLYREKHFVGAIVDPDENMWFDLSDEWIQLKQVFNKGTIIEIVDKLVWIFNIGSPNDTRLSMLFGTEYDYIRGGLIALCGMKKAVEDKEKYEEKYGKGKAGMDIIPQILGRVKNIEREYNDIVNVEMDIDIESLEINELYLYVQEVPDKELIEAKLTGVYNSVQISNNNSIVIQGKDFKIVVSSC